LKPPQLTALPSVDCCYDAGDTKHAAAVFRGFFNRYLAIVAHMQASVTQAAVTLVLPGDLLAWQQEACRQLVKLPQSLAPASVGLLLANIIASKGKFAVQQALQQMGMPKEEAAETVGDPDVEAFAQSICSYYQHVRVGATLSAHVVSSP
jgi:hypothetical protein